MLPRFVKRRSVLSMFRVGTFASGMYREEGGFKTRNGDVACYFLTVMLLDGFSVMIFLDVGVFVATVKLRSSNARFANGNESSKTLSHASKRKNFLMLRETSIDWFVSKPVGMHAVPPPITGTFMPPSNKPDIDDTHDKSSDSETTDFASCVSSVQTSSSKTNEPLASVSSSDDLKNFHKTDNQGPCNITQSPSFSFKENVKTPRNLCNRNGPNMHWGSKNNGGSHNLQDNPHTNKDLGIVDS
ncbi:hypothetical protein Tco_1314610 [Tanacetum coccineum]